MLAKSPLPSNNHRSGDHRGNGDKILPATTPGGWLRGVSHGVTCFVPPVLPGDGRVSWPLLGVIASAGHLG